MDIHKNQRLRFIFPNSGEVLTDVSDPELIGIFSPSLENSPSAFFSSKIVHKHGPVFGLTSDLEPTEFLNNLKIDLGMPEDALMIHLTARGFIFGPRWQNYYLRFAGIVIEQGEQSETSSPLLHISDLDGNDIQLVQVWFQRASTWASPVYGDIRWHPDKGLKLALTNEESATRWTEVKAAWRGRELLQHIKKVGRPDSSGRLSRTQFIERAPQACARLMRLFDETPTDAEIAAELHISRTTLYRYLEREGLKLNELRDMAVGLIIEPAPF